MKKEIIIKAKKEAKNQKYCSRCGRPLEMWDEYEVEKGLCGYCMNDIEN
jgi:hypothetical protein